MSAAIDKAAIRCTMSSTRSLPFFQESIKVWYLKW